MKKQLYFKKFFLIMFLTFGLFTNCKKEPEKYFDTSPVADVYKTKGDYFNFANTWGAQNCPSVLSLKDIRISLIDNDTIYNQRWKLVDNYVLGIESDINDYFTNITFPEIVAYNESHSEYFPKDSFFERVIDTDPFLEYYVDVNDTFHFRDSINIQKINKLIKDGELEKYFKRIK